MEKREQVFVSSTYEDLVEERKEVILGLLQADCFPAGMELFPASNDEKWNLIKGVIDDSDYYLLIIAGRYGSVDPETKISYTEMEFDYAVKSGKPVIAVLHAAPGELPANRTDQDQQKAKKLTAFRAKAEKKMVKYWREPAELPGHIAHALMQLRKKNEPVGWVRGNLAMTPETRAEIAELRAALAEARSSKSDKSQPMFDDLAQGDDAYTFSGELTFTCDDGKQYLGGFDWEITWDQVFRELGPMLLHETEERRIGAKVERILRGFVFDDANPVQTPDDFKPEAVTSVDNLDIDQGTVLDDVLVQLIALRFVERGTLSRGINDRNRYWKLTSQGEDRLMGLRAVRRGAN